MVDKKRREQLKDYNNKKVPHIHLRDRIGKKTLEVVKREVPSMQIVYENMLKNDEVKRKQ
jgi:hypothetical protein